MNSPTKVFVCGGDGAGWAIDEDRRLTIAAIERTATIVESPEQADVIHSCWWQALAAVARSNPQAIRGKPVICHMTGDPARCMGEPDFAPWLKRVSLWIAQSRSALDRLHTLGLQAAYMPYSVDFDLYANAGGNLSQATLDAAGRLPPNAYVIANFHRDTCGAVNYGKDGSYAPKLVKGPDMFVEIVAELRRRGENVVALLAGPRRHWVRRELAARDIPFVFVGEETARDDYPGQILSQRRIAELYSLAHLCLVTSRNEGGPRAILESAAAGIATLSTPVGHAPDVLCAECLFTDPLDAVEAIVGDIRTGSLRKFAPAHSAIVKARHTVVQANWEAIYSKVELLGEPVEPCAPMTSLSTRVEVKSKPCISFWNKFAPPPWGGGNQFMAALMAEATRQGCACIRNGEGVDPSQIHGHIVNSVQFDMERFTSLVKPGESRVLHRIDGPISILRGTTESLDLDRACFEFNARYADATIIQSWHTVDYLSQLGLSPVNPALILNACDPTIFNTPIARPAPQLRLRIVATSWSPSPGKGAAVYQWIDQHLDHDRYEFTFVGNCPVKLRHCRVIEPMASEPLAQLLRQHDVYITASRNDPCSNALIEAMSCGLPAIYLQSGGHPELVGFGGLGFSRPEQIPELLERIRNNYDMYRALLAPESMADVCKKYVSLLFNTQLVGIAHRESSLEAVAA